MDDIYEEFGLVPTYAPYIDEETAKFVREANDLREEVEELEKENKALADEIKELRGSASNGDIHSDKSSEVGTTATFEMTYYGMDCAGCTGLTASGYSTKGRTTYDGMTVLAADTSILPLHTIVKVTNEHDGKSYTGIVKDRGGVIKGRKLDVLVGSEAESSKYGRHKAKVEVIKYGDNKYKREG